MEKEEDFQIPEANENQNENQPSSAAATGQSVNPTTSATSHPSLSHPQISSLTEAQKKQYAPIDWKTCFDELFYLDNGTSVFSAGNQGVLYFCIHGAGQSALSFARLAQEVKKYGTLVAFDLKGHGESKAVSKHDKQDLSDDFSIVTLVKETLENFRVISKLPAYEKKNVIMVGHSLGGSICTRVTDILANEEKNERIQGMVIIDVVEGTAIQALPFMNQILNDRPQHFASIQSAIKWSVTSGNLKKADSARISIPPQLKQVQLQNGLICYTWKVNLKETEKHWIEWFKGLSSIFLKVVIPKVLVTAEKERLDKELTIAQMQGKFKLTILYNVGHSVQEDDYKGVAKMLNQFIHDFRIPMDQDQEKRKKEVGIAKFSPAIKAYHEHI